MTNRPHRTDLDRPFSTPLSDEGSTVRERAPASQRPSRKSDPNLSLDQRLESKLAEAAALLAKLEPQDARSRLLHIAMLRKDEALLDGILAELALPPRTTRRPR
jgi:DNA-binding TFAR19-related protein (PDSD5 family)